ncbi:MAG TPA: putative molybdenum carrier protein [Stellaceae bacterium]|jgi:Circularly permutated YpsA SLOG family|nr:putative molybdenum carrier protein [Stellaceae bacterium]
MRLARIISGGQTGVDLAALDAALAAGFPCGGWVPRGRCNEDGPLDPRYPVKETDSRKLARRTEMNVRDSDATLILSRGALSGGSALTEKLAQRHAKPCLHVDLGALSPEEAIERTRSWLAGIDGTVLNIAGPRCSSDAEVYALARRVIEALISS